MAQVNSLSFINAEGVREKREIVDSQARALIDEQERKILALEEVDEDFLGGGHSVGGAFEKFPLALLTHIADLEAAYLDECRG